MSDNLLIDREAFSQGYLQVLQKEGNFLTGVGDFANKHLSSGGGGLLDQAYNGTVGAAKSAGKGAIDLASKGVSRFINGVTPALRHASSEAGAGAVEGGSTEFGKQMQRAGKWLGDQTSGFMDSAKQFGTGLLNDPAKAIGDHPFMAAGGAAALLGGGYYGGKALGLWGGDNNNNQGSNGQGNNNFSSNGQSGPPPMMQSAYTQGYTPQALNKAGEEFPIPGMLMNRLSPAISLGTSIYNGVNGPQQNITTPREELVVNPETDRVNKLLRNPKMRDYITTLLRETSPRV
jgi:hypothetical protein